MAEKKSNGAYRTLQQHLDQFPIGFPASDSGADIRLLKHLFTPEEAEIAIYMKLSFESINDIYEHVKDRVDSIENLEEILDNLVRKGSIGQKKEDGRKFYTLVPLVVGMYEFQVNKLTKEFLEDFNEYAWGPFSKEMFSTRVPQLRVIPVEESIAPHHQIETYDHLKNIIDSLEGPICITNCVCRQSQALLGHPCTQTKMKESCLVFHSWAQTYIDQGWGRSINKEEAYSILKQAEEDGLVLQPGNYLNPDSICLCCGCCCGLLKELKRFSRPLDFMASNFHAEIDVDACSGCGTCAIRCQMKAIKMRKDIPRLNLKKCIGCGLCVPTCPSEAIILIRTEKVAIPPSNLEDLQEKIMEIKKSIIR